MNVVISDTAEYGNYLFANAATPLLAEKLMPSITPELLGKGLSNTDLGVDNMALVQVNRAIREHDVEWIGEELRDYMTDMKQIIE